MKSAILHVYGFQLSLARKLVDDIPDHQLAELPTGCAHHAAWLLGHLCHAANNIGTELGAPWQMSPEWDELFDQGTGAGEARERYPSREELLEVLSRQHEQTARLLSETSDERLATPYPDGGYGGLTPTLGDACAFMMLWHEAHHLAQLAVWRRCMGYPSALGL